MRHPLVSALAAAGAALLGLLLMGTAQAVPPLRCAFCEAPAAAALGDPTPYVLLSPLLRPLDALALMSVDQHIAFMVTVLLAAVAWRAATFAAGPRGGLVRAMLREGSVMALVLGGLVATYAAAVVFPRPQSRLAAAHPDDVVVDFHSHTRHSHDVRDAMTVARNRAWHRALGFDVAYVTDHARLHAAEELRRTNPDRAGDGTVLLPGVELRHEGQHVVLSGLEPGDSVHFPEGHVDAAGLERLRTASSSPVPVILALPGSLDPRDWATVPDAIEGIDAAPRGLEQLDRDRDRIRALRDSLGIPLVASTNNHGWFAGAVAWSLVRVPGWREMPPGELDLAIRRAVVEGGPDAVRVVERTRFAPPVRAVGLAGTLPVGLWQVARTLTPLDRAVWLLWSLLLMTPLVLRARAEGRDVPSGAREGPEVQERAYVSQSRTQV